MENVNAGTFPTAALPFPRSRTPPGDKAVSPRATIRSLFPKKPPLNSWRSGICPDGMGKGDVAGWEFRDSHKEEPSHPAVVTIPGFRMGKSCWERFWMQGLLQGKAARKIHGKKISPRGGLAIPTWRRSTDGNVGKSSWDSAECPCPWHGMGLEGL